MKQVKTTVRNQQWSIHLRSRVGDSVSHSGTDWTNVTGKNSEPGFGTDWVISDLTSSGSTPYNTAFIFDETPQTVPLGFEGIITNLNNTNATVTFTVVGTVLTVTGGADADEKLLINGKY